MASNTPNLDLLKKDPIVDANDTFNIETMLNENWDKIDDSIGDNTIDDTLSPSTDTGLSVKILLSWLANMIKSITGKASWRIKPTRNLEELNIALTTHEAESMQLKEVHGLRIERGTWTPILGWGNIPDLVNEYEIQEGNYYIIGKKLHVSFQIKLKSKDTRDGGSVKIQGLPFPTQSDTSFRPVGNLYFENVEIPVNALDIKIRKIYGNPDIFLQATGNLQPAFNFKGNNLRDNSLLIGSIELIIS